MEGESIGYFWYEGNFHYTNPAHHVHGRFLHLLVVFFKWLPLVFEGLHCTGLSLPWLFHSIYFILVAIANGIVSVFIPSLFNLVYRKASNFWCVSLLINLLPLLQCLPALGLSWCSLWGSLMYRIMFSAHRDMLTSSFLNCAPFISFICLNTPVFKHYIEKELGSSEALWLNLLLLFY